MSNTEKVHELVAAIEDIIQDQIGGHMLRSGWDGSMTPNGGTVAHMLDDALTEAKAQAWDECEAASYEIRLAEDGKSWAPVKDNPYRAQLTKK